MTAYVFTIQLMAIAWLKVVQECHTKPCVSRLLRVRQCLPLLPYLLVSFNQAVDISVTTPFFATVSAYLMTFQGEA